MSKTLSIIIPIYQTEKYIQRCIESCIINDKSLMEQLEIVLVDNATKDNAAKIAHQYAIQYPNSFVELSLDQNKCHGGAINLGLKYATGKYVRLLDSDDWLTNLERLLVVLNNYKADIVFTQVVKYYADKDEYQDFPIIEDSYELKNINLFDFKTNHIPNIANFWHATYKRSILEFNRPILLENVGYDDGVLFVAPFIKAKTYLCCDFVLYNYFIGRSDQSLFLEHKPQNIKDRILNCIYMNDFWQMFKPSDVGTNIEIGVKNIISNNAWYVFGDVILLPYWQARDVEKKMRHMFVFDRNASKAYRRYTNMPFWMYYFVYKFRYLVKRYI